MNNDFYKELICPSCQSSLKFIEKNATISEDYSVTGILNCATCQNNYYIIDNIPFFGLKKEKKDELHQEMASETEWEYLADMQDHLKWAEQSSSAGERLIKKIQTKLPDTNPDRLKVLDLGAGVGAFHSWQFSQYGFNVVSLEICPEFFLAIDYITPKDRYERIVTDCTLLPFRDDSFDIIFCKELVHHFKNPSELLSEIYRVARPDAMIIIREPCISVFRSRIDAFQTDKAAKMGIQHNYYSYFDYRREFDQIASKIEIDGDLTVVYRQKKLGMRQLNRFLQHFNSVPRLKGFMIILQSIIIGGSCEFIGFKKEDRVFQHYNREIVPFTLSDIKIDRTKVQFYRHSLIPALLEIFKRKHVET